MSHLDCLIRQDVEHGTFSPRNIFNDEYLTPQFYTYAKQLEAQIERMKCCGNCKHYTQKSNYLLGICKERYNVEGNNICNEWELINDRINSEQ